MAITVKIHAGSYKILESTEFRLRRVIKNKGAVGFKRSRRIWTIKRSPHVFSKSQESFGIETYKAVLKYTDITSPKGLTSNNKPNSVSTEESVWWETYGEMVTKFACSNHMNPGSTISWTRHI